MFLGDSILNALGIAAGTAGLLVPSFFFIAMFIAMAIKTYRDKMAGVGKLLGLCLELLDT